MDITITLSAPNLAELTAGMRTILEQLEKGATLPADVQRVAEAAEAAEAAAPPVAPPKQSEATSAPETEGKPASAPAATDSGGGESAPSVEDIRAILVKLRRVKGASAASDLIRKHGGSKLSDVPEENRSALLAEASEMADAEVRI